MESRQRNSLIDAYRGIAILAVMAYHYTVRWPDLYGYASSYSPMFKLGKYGVHLFFVISGLVITMTVLRSATSIEFAARRVARLYPAFVACACTTFVLMHWGPPELRRGTLDLLASFSMDARALGRQFVDGAYWSLAVEVKFYLYVALARLVLKDKFWLGILLLAFISALPFGRAWAYATIAQWWPYFLLGMAGWYFIAEQRRWVALALGLASIALYGYQRPAGLLWPEIMVHAAIWGSALSMLILLWKAPQWNPWAVRWLARLGAISYSLYLLHQNLGVALIAKQVDLGIPDVLAMLIAGVAMAALATLSYRLVEQPGNRLVMQVYRRVSRSRADRTLSELSRSHG